jgi:Domain of Unknown Function (DUF928)
MSRDETEGLSELYQDVLESEFPAPELLARYAAAPNDLSEAERLEVESAMQRSQAVVDELDTIRGFDFGQLDADQVKGREGGLIVLLGGLLQQPVAWAGLAAAAAALLWVALGQQPSRDPTAQTPQLVEESTPEAIQAPTDLPRVPAEIEDALVPEAVSDPLLAEVPPTTPNKEIPIEDPDLAPSNEVELAAEPAREETGGRSGDIEDEVATPEATDQERPEILIAMLMPRYEMPIGAAMRDSSASVYRAAEDQWPSITTLSPAHVAWSASTQPTLYWHIDRLPALGDFHLTISDSDDNVLADNLRLAKVESPGIQHTPLSDLGINLSRDVEYRWSISHRLEEESPPTHYSFGWVRSVELAPAVREQIDAAKPAQLPAALARSGYWYDALNAAFGLTTEYPSDERPREALRALLEQGGLSAVSE